MTLDELPAWEALMTPGAPIDLLLDALRHRPAWMADAACAEHLDVDFVPTPPRPGRPASAAEEAALAICRGCSVREECLAFALDGREAGVWGGTTERERRQMLGRPAA